MMMLNEVESVWHIQFGRAPEVEALAGPGIELPGIDPRTIQRHLGREGGSFSTIIESVRRELAGRFLKEHHRSIAEVSSLLGFSATTGFSRWYRQQFRVTPSAGRARVPSGGMLSRKMPGT